MAFGARLGKRPQDRPGGVAVKDVVVALVVVRPQAVVARCHARRRCVRRFFPGVRVEVEEFERLARDDAEGLTVVDEAREDAGTALGGLVQEDLAAIVAVGDRFGGEVDVFQLVDGLDRAFEGRLDACHRGAAGAVVQVLAVENVVECQDEGVASVFNVGHDASHLVRRGQA